MDILGGLNDEQRAAVEHTEGALLVVAGAGTGKTGVITRRIARLIEQGQAKPGEVLALTFTEKAAREMADRLYDLVGWQSFQVPVLTFNAFGAELLGRFASHIGRSTRGGLLNTTQKTLLLQQHIERVVLEYYPLKSHNYDFLEQIVRYIERLQNGGIGAGRYADFVAGLKAEDGEQHEYDILEQRDLAALFTLYESVKAETGTYDYNDQLAIPLGAMRERPNLAERLTKQYRYVLVDEYQDTSPVQDQLLRTFVPVGGNIFAVGDDDQAIYGFRGADIANIMDFAAHFKVDEPAVLVKNYRSGQPILDAAYRLIGNNDPNRLEAMLHLNKRLTAQDQDAKVTFVGYRTPADEQSGVVDDVMKSLSGGAVPASIAILARSNAVLRSYAKSLRAHDVPFTLSTEVNIFEQREIINLWYLLEWLGHRAKPEAIAHVVLGPFVGWKTAAYRTIVERSQSELAGPEEIIRVAAEDGDSQAQELTKKLDIWRAWAAELNVSQLAYRLVFETGLSERLVVAAEGSDRIIRVFEDLHMLLAQMQDYETVALDPTLAGYLATFPKPPQLEAPEALGEAEGVQLLTVHASKGLEFDTVYVVGCTARAWAERSSSGLEPPTELMTAGTELPPEHEQRRLMYVAVTRAKRSVIISAASETAGGQRQALSPLVTELLGEMPPAARGAGETKSIDRAMQRLQRFYPLKHELPDRRLPFETIEGWIELGVGALDAYRRCPHEFYLQYVLGIVQPFGPQLAFGTAIHGAIQAYYEAKIRDEQIGLAELDVRLDELWSDRGYESRAQAVAAWDKAHETLQRFVQREEREARHVLGSELKITLELPDYKLRLRGRIDAYFETPDGIEIRDFKTGSKRDAEKVAVDAKENFQLRTYAMAYKEMTGQSPALVTLDYVVTGAEGSAQLTARIMANHRDKLGALAERIRARDFAPAPVSEFHQCPAFTYYGEEPEEQEQYA